MKNKVLSLLSAAVLVLALGSVAKADTFLYLTKDNCSTPCNPGSPGTSMGTVTLSQIATGEVQITISLVSPLEFVNTGLVNTIDFNIIGTPTISASNFSNSDFSLASTTAGSNHFDGFGTFEYSIQMGGSQGAGGAQASPLTFDISATGLTVADFLTDGTGANVFFGVDVYNSAVPSTGPIGTGTPTSPVPEPGSLALFGTGILGMAGYLRRKLLS